MNKLRKFYYTLRYDIPMFIKNIWYFRKALYNYRNWDYKFTLDLFSLSLSDILKGLENNSYEEDSSKDKKIKNIRRAVELLNIISEESYMTVAENEYGYKYLDLYDIVETDTDSKYEIVFNGTNRQKQDNYKLVSKSMEIEEEYWIELWTIIRGTKYSNPDSSNEFDGSDMRYWWN